jgi:ribosomal protein L7/L12
VDTVVYSLLGWVIGGVITFLVIRAAAVTSRLERKLDLLLRHSGVDLPATAVAEATALMRAGKKIEAIKAYRELTGCGLAEAKAKVESLT